MSTAFISPTPPAPIREKPGFTIERTSLPIKTSFETRYLFLLMLVLQNSALTLTLHYTRVVPITGKGRYLTSTTVFFVELAKLVVSLGFTFHEALQQNPSESPFGTSKKVWNSVFTVESYKLALPAVAYTIQSYLLYTSISNLSVTTFQVTYQLKILTTVLFSVLLLHKRVSLTKWLSLVLLTVGIAIVQIPESALFGLLQKSSHATNMEGPNKILELQSAAMKTPKNASLGLLSVLGAATISGLTGVYFEKVVKETSASVSMWTRNVQLSLYSLIPAILIGIVCKDGSEIYRNGFFVGYDRLVWITIVLQALGGLTVAMCIIKMENVIKNFAVSISIVCSFLVEVFLFKTPVTFNFLFGTSIVLFATYLYSRRSKPILS